MKYKAGDKVRIKSLDWYNESERNGNIYLTGRFNFIKPMADFCGKIVTIKEVQSPYSYHIFEDGGIHYYTDEMIEGLVKEDVTTSEPQFRLSDVSLEKEMEWNLPDGYEFRDENGNIINASKIILEKKKKEYPKTYAECSDILSVYTDPDISGYKGELL